MSMVCTPPNTALTFQLRFAPLMDGVGSLAFSCDATGRVDMDALDERTRINYLYARAMVGREFESPVMHSRLRFGGDRRVRE